MKLKQKSPKWWDNNGGFFGSGYFTGDNSVEGYLPDKSETQEERTMREVDGLIRLLNPKKKGIIDCPCGYGRHSIELARRGYGVLGIDINEDHLGIAYRLKQQNKLEIERSKGQCDFLKEDMRVLNKEEYAGKATSILNMFYSFGFFEDEADNVEVMKGFYNSLVSGGKLLLHTDVSPEIIYSGNYRFNEERMLKEGGTLTIKEGYDETTKRINGLWKIEHGEKITTLTPYSVRIYSREEFKEMAKKVGFSTIDFYGSFDGEAFSSESKEMIMVAQK